MNISRPLLLTVLLASFLLAPAALAESGTWLPDPINNDWNTPANWSSGTVPAGSTDIATFALSNITNVSVSAFSGVSGITFSPGADAFTISAPLGTYMQFLGVGITNSSVVEQNFVSPASGGSSGGYVFFGRGFSGPTITGPVTFTQEAGDEDSGPAGFAIFQIGAFAGDATLHNLGATVTGGVGGHTDFIYNMTSADQSTIINEGATAPGAIGGQLISRQVPPPRAMPLSLPMAGATVAVAASSSFAMAR